MSEPMKMIKQSDSAWICVVACVLGIFVGISIGNFLGKQQGDRRLESCKQDLELHRKTIDVCIDALGVCVDTYAVPAVSR